MTSWRKASPLTAAGPRRTCTGFPRPLAYAICGATVPRARDTWHRGDATAEPYDVGMELAVSTRPRLWLPVLAWALVIFALSSVPSLTTGLGTWDLVLRKLAHAAEFALLAALLQRWLARPWLALLAASAYAATDELHQAFVAGRVASPVDWAIDTAGALIGVALYVAFERRR